MDGMNQITIGCCTLIHGDCFELLPGIIKDVNAIICDPPFSERTHSGHDMVKNGSANAGNDFSDRRALGYDAWSDGDAEQFCSVANLDGWLVVLTDHVLFQSFEKHTNALGRYTFAPLPSFTPGRSVRLCGDGPSSWTDWIMVSRRANQSKWGTLPGGYISKSGINKAGGVVTQMGGKPVSLMSALVRDYSRSDDLVCDPVMGSGSTGIACYMTGRKFIGIEKDEGRFNTAVKRIERELQQVQLFV